MTPDCLYCQGYRCECSCTSDCGARPEDAGHYCPKAEGFRDYLRSTGLYPETEQEQPGESR